MAAYELPMFPLEQTVLPSALIPLHVFEPRYRALASDVTAAVDPEFGVVMIERGREVGGDDQRADVGVVARVLDHREYDDGRWGIVAGATRRIRVQRWLPDDPYPKAVVEDFPDTDADRYLDTIDPATIDVLGEAVDRLLAVARRLDPRRAPATVELPPDPAAATWHAAAVAGLGPLDSIELLRIPDAATRAGRVVALVEDRAAMLEALADEAG